MRESDYLNSAKWPQFIINILNVVFIPIVFNQIAFSSATLAVYHHRKKTGPQCFLQWPYTAETVVWLEKWQYKSHINNMHNKLRSISGIQIIIDPH
jgi:hypothetical protein